MIFENKIRTYEGNITTREKTFEYYDRSSRKEVAIVREELNKWFDKYPADGKEELRSRFRRASFSAAFFELFIHELLRLQGFDIQLHPLIPNSKDRPDFFVKKGGVEFYVEATELMDASDQEQARKNKSDRFFEELNRLKSLYYYIQIKELEFFTDRQPATSKIIKALMNKMESYDYQCILDELTKKGPKSLPCFVYSDKDVRMTIILLPVDAPKDKDEIIGIYPFETLWGTPEQKLIEGIQKKAKKYGNLDKPLLLCLNYLGKKTIYREDVINLLNERKAMKSDKISGIFVSKIHEFNVHVADYHLIKNPNARLNIDLDSTGLSYNYIMENEQKTVDGLLMSEILQLNADWISF